MNVVFGGTFNPITLAHERIAEMILQKFSLDYLIFLPVGKKYLRKKVNIVDHRINMINLVFKNNPKIKTSLIEINSDTYMGTYLSLKSLSEYYDDIYFLLGADNLYDLNTWINHDLLIKEYKFIVLNRNKKNIEEYIEKNYNTYKDRFILLDFDVDIAASRIRENVEKYKNDLNPKVYQYIKENKLYEVN